MHTKLDDGVLDYIEDIFNIEEVLDLDDDLVIITKDNPNDGLNLLQNIKRKTVCNIYNLHDYLYNCLDNVLQPKFTVINEEEKKMMKKYNVVSDNLFLKYRDSTPLLLL